MTSRTSGARALDARIAASGAAALSPGTFGPVRRIRPAAKATRSTRSTEAFVARPIVTAPDTSRLRAAVQRTAEIIGDRMGMPGRDVTVLASLVMVVGMMFATAIAVTSEPAPSFERQLEVQHAEWLADQAQAAPAATMAP